MTLDPKPHRVSRRRVISILASASAALPFAATTQPARPIARWHGVALGADVSLELHGATQADIAAARAVLSEIEATFSLFQPGSELSQINANGHGQLSSDMAELLHLCASIHDATGGLFDPTIQPVFRALMAELPPPWARVGWHKLHLSPHTITLGAGQAITLNGIAQGFATDRVRNVLRARGLKHALISVGELAAMGGPFKLGIADPVHGIVGTRSLTDRCSATSSPTAMMMHDAYHILHPDHARPDWATVNVEAPSAALADGLSTALCFAPVGLVRRIATHFHARVTLIDFEGNVQTIG